MGLRPRRSDLTVLFVPDNKTTKNATPLRAIGAINESLSEVMKAPKTSIENQSLQS